MKAVMDALTHRERSIIEALIKHGGRTTQAEIRYETGLPRSSLTMVLVSLERRNLITKKEWGRTNVIELSESFFSKKEQSRTSICIQTNLHLPSIHIVFYLSFMPSGDRRAARMRDAR
jgi:DNA-binding MarR family transcriptional regulator